MRKLFDALMVSGGVLFVVVWVILSFAVPVAMFYVAFHFISKYW